MPFLPTTIQRCPHDQENPYAMISNELIRDESLPPECRWMLIYLLSNKPGWKITTQQLINHLKGHKGCARDRVRKWIQLCIEAGYIKREAVKEGGRYAGYVYYLSERPKFKEMSPQTPVPVAEKSFEKPSIKNISPSPEIAGPDDAGRKEGLSISSLRSDIQKKKKISLVGNRSDPPQAREEDHPDKPVGRESIPKFQEQDFKVAQKIFEQSRKIVPKAKVPKLEDWSDEIRLMRERDGRSTEQLIEILDWAFEDSFWCSVIQSPTSLRKHFEKMWLKKHPPLNKGTLVAKNRDYARKVSDFLVSIGKMGLLKTYKEYVYNMKTRDSVNYDLPEDQFKEIILKWSDIEEKS